MDATPRVCRTVALGVLAFGTFVILSGLSIAAESSNKTAAEPPVTFAKDIAPIFQEKCQDCHRKGSLPWRNAGCPLLSGWKVVV